MRFFAGWKGESSYQQLHEKLLEKSKHDPQVNQGIRVKFFLGNFMSHIYFVSWFIYRTVFAAIQIRTNNAGFAFSMIKIANLAFRATAKNKI
jgi:hypothetical protein